MVLTKLAMAESKYLLRHSDYLRTIWKNGRGITDQIAIFPAGEDFKNLNFHWRLSTAPLKDSGAFSLFPGFVRSLVVVDGQGIELVGDDKKVMLTAFTPYEFSGDNKIHGQLSDGPIRDLNVIWNPKNVRVEVSMLLISEQQQSVWRPNADINFLFLAEGSMQTEWGMMERFSTIVSMNGQDINLTATSMNCQAVVVEVFSI